MTMRPVGFAPEEISSLRNRRVLDEHVSSAAALWSLRERAVGAPHFRLLHLARLDERLLAHLEGLRVSGPTGQALAMQALGEGEPAAVFVAAWLAFSAQEPDAMRSVLQASLAEPVLHRALVAALAWTAPARLEPAWTRLAASPLGAHRCLALAVASARRENTSGLLDDALAASDPLLRARALRAAGEARRVDLRARLHPALDDADAACRHWAAWSLLLLGVREMAPQVLATGARQPGWSRMALEHAVRAGDPDAVRGWVRAWAGDALTRRQAVIAAGMLGDPVVLPWLIDQMQDPFCARAAAEAFETITGVDLDLQGFKQEAPADAPDSNCEDEDLVWPDAAAVAAWWSTGPMSLQPGRRYLAGYPISAPALRHLLRTGYQRQRAAAALELVLVEPREALFPVRARADWQRRSLAP